MVLSAELVEIWKSFRKNGDQIPIRKALNPAKLINYLPFLVVVERGGAGELLIRLAGTGIDDLFKVHLRGQNALLRLSGSTRKSIDLMYTLLDKHKCGAKGKRIFSTAGGLRAAGEVTILPLVGKVEEAPQFIIWYNIENMDMTKLYADRLVDYNYDKFEFIDLGNGIPDDDPATFINQSES